MERFENQEQFEKRRRVSAAFQIISRHKWSFLSTLICILAFTALYSMMQPKKYKATASLIVRDRTLSERGGIADLSGEGTMNIQNELEILKSTDLLTAISDKIVKDFRRRPQTSKDSIPILKAALSRTGIEDSAALAGSLNSKLIAMTSFDLQRDKNIIKISCESTDPAEAAYLANLYASTYYRKDLIRSRANASVIRDFLEEQKNGRSGDLQSSESRLQNYMEREGISRLEDQSQDVIKKIADIRSEIERGEVERKRNSLMIANYEKELQRIVPLMTKKMLGGNDLYIDELQKTLAKNEADRDVARIISGKDASKPEYQKEISHLSGKIDSLRSILSAKTSDYIKGSMAGYNLGRDREGRSENAVSSLSGQIRDLKIQNNSLELSSKVLSGYLRKYSDKFSRLPKQSVNLARLTREKDLNERLYSRIGEQLQEAKLAELSTFGRVEMLDYAFKPLMPSSPNLPLNALVGLILGLLGGVFVCLVQNYVFQDISAPEDIEALGARLLSTVPRLKLGTSAILPMGELAEKQINSKRLLSEKTETAFAFESYLRLQVYLTYSFLEGKIKSVLISSSGPGEGKSSTACNLAITLANSGKKVLLVDADLRYPAIHRYLGLDNSQSLEDYLSGDSNFEEVIQLTRTNGLSVVTSKEYGRNPTTILSGDRMTDFMGIVSSLYDFVIYDTPPVNIFTDAIHLAKKTDEVILVTRADITNANDLTKATRLFEQFHIKVGGVVLNDYKRSNSHGNYGKYYKYYGRDREGRHPALGRKRIARTGMEKSV